MRDAFPDLEAALAGLLDEDPATRTAAARRIGLEGPAAGAAGPALVERLEDTEPMVRAMAAAALGKVLPSHPADVVTALAACLEDGAFPVRFWAAESLGRHGPVARGALRALERLQDDENKAVRGAAALAIARIRQAPSRA